MSIFPLIRTEKKRLITLNHPYTGHGEVRLSVYYTQAAGFSRPVGVGAAEQGYALEKVPECEG